MATETITVRIKLDDIFFAETAELLIECQEIFCDAAYQHYGIDQDQLIIKLSTDTDFRTLAKRAVKNWIQERVSTDDLLDHGELTDALMLDADHWYTQLAEQADTYLNELDDLEDLIKE